MLFLRRMEKRQLGRLNKLSSLLSFYTNGGVGWGGMDV